MSTRHAIARKVPLDEDGDMRAVFGTRQPTAMVASSRKMGGGHKTPLRA
jgi:hypothetical protein